MNLRSGCERSRRLRLPALAACLSLPCLLLAAGGAQASSTPDSRSAPAVAAPPAATAPPVAAAPAAIEDKSWPDERYISWGLAAYDHDWSSRDLGHAADRLKSLSMTHPDQLPRFESERSGKTFARLAAPADVSFFRRRSLSLDVRLPEALERFQASGALFELYLSAFAAKQVAGADLIELIGALLRNCVVVVELVDELVAKLPKDDPGYQERMAGLDQMRGGLAEVLSGAITGLTEEEYTIAARLKLLGYCRETFPGIVPRLTAPSQAEVRQRLDALAAEPRPRELQPQLLQLRDAVHAALKPDSQQ